MSRYDDTDLFSRPDDRTIRANRRLHSAQALAAALSQRPERTRSEFDDLVADLEDANPDGRQVKPA